MTYEKLCFLKYKKGVSTQELIRLYPKEVVRVSEVALLDLPESILREVLTEADHLEHVMSLKEQFSTYLD